MNLHQKFKEIYNELCKGENIINQEMNKYRAFNGNFEVCGFINKKWAYRYKQYILGFLEGKCQENSFSYNIKELIPKREEKIFCLMNEGIYTYHVKSKFVLVTEYFISLISNFFDAKELEILNDLICSVIIGGQCIISRDKKNEFQFYITVLNDENAYNNIDYILLFKNKNIMKNYLNIILQNNFKYFMELINYSSELANEIKDFDSNQVIGYIFRNCDEKRNSLLLEKENNDIINCSNGINNNDKNTDIKMENYISNNYIKNMNNLNNNNNMKNMNNNNYMNMSYMNIMSNMIQMNKMKNMMNINSINNSKNINKINNKDNKSIMNDINSNNTICMINSIPNISKMNNIDNMRKKNDMNNINIMNSNISMMNNSMNNNNMMSNRVNNNNMNNVNNNIINMNNINNTNNINVNNDNDKPMNMNIINQYEKQINDLNNKIGNLEKELNDYKKNSILLNEKINQLNFVIKEKENNNFNISKSSQIKIDEMQKKINLLNDQEKSYLVLIKDKEKKINEQDGEIEKLNKDLKDKSSEILNLMELIKEKDEKIKKIEFETQEEENLFSVIFCSKKEEIIYPLIYKKADLFSKIENLFYDNYPEYSKKNCNFYVKGIKIEKEKTLEENKINKNVIITFY